MRFMGPSEALARNAQAIIAAQLRGGAATQQMSGTKLSGIIFSGQASGPLM